MATSSGMLIACWIVHGVTGVEPEPAVQGRARTAAATRGNRAWSKHVRLEIATIGHGFLLFFCVYS
jgi:hypothetical protein